VLADPAVWITELRASHQRQADLVGRLGPEDLRRPSYDRDWTVTQVLGHMGSGAEITRLRVDAALTGSPPLGREDFQKIWSRWDGMAPEAVAEAMVESDRACVARFESLDERALRDLRVPFLPGREQDARAAAASRLNEHALHSWDTAVTFDPEAKVAPGSVPLLLANLVEELGWLVARMVRRKAGDSLASKLGDQRVLVRTTDPDRWVVIVLGEEPRVLGAEPDGQARLVIPAEAFLRLVYGRLDPDHTPPGIDVAPPLRLDDLRVLFPGLS
jgi:uncharacterized protein (TIGR03083 family)